MGSGAVLVFCAGFSLRGLLNDASQLAEAKLELQKHIELENVYHAASANYQKLNNSLLTSNAKLMDDANALPETNCDKLPITDDKLRLLKKSRSNLATR